jgi:hypothetical protein
LVLNGGFTVTDSQQRHLDQQASRPGFGHLRARLQALLDDGWSIPQLAIHLDTTQAAIRRAITEHQLRQLPRRDRVARQRQRAAQQRTSDRAATLGFEAIRAYLVDRLVTKAWTLAKVQGELGTAPATLRHPLDRYQVRRVEATQWQRVAAAAAIGPTTQARAVHRRPQARLAELGEAELGDYLQDRIVRREWSRRRLCAELGVGYDWLDQQLTQLGLRSRAAGLDGRHRQSADAARLQ